MTHPPGSHAARALGCSCDPISNGYGAGVPGSERHTPLFNTRPGCRLHGTGAGYVWTPSPREAAPEPIILTADELYDQRRTLNRAKRQKKAAA